MKKDTTRNTTKEKLEILESDDEFPDSYNETPDIPAYQDDHRFDRHENNEFMWLYKKLEDLNTTSTRSGHPKQKPFQEEPHPKSQPENIKLEHELSLNKQSQQIERGQDSQKPCISDDELSGTNRNGIKQKDESKTREKKILISKGILSKRNIFLIKSIEEYSMDSTLLWFIEYLNSNEIKPLQRSCLVCDITSDHYVATKVPLTGFNKRYTFKMIIN